MYRQGSGWEEWWVMGEHPNVEFLSPKRSGGTSGLSVYYRSSRYQ
ncbi:hypothetical protein [Methanopyrus sp.]